MAEFTFWYSESATYRAFFKADSLEEATELLRQVNDGERMLEDLPEFDEKQKGNDIDIDVDGLEEIE